jgi:membrane-bound metal-dependent hydrolase YbcI (DUF457 family)
MEGRSHLLVGLAAGVVLDGVVHLTGEPLTMAKTVPLILIANKAAYYFSVGFGALLPDIDNARSTLGKKFGIVSKEIQHFAGHRTFFHSILGLAFFALLGIGLERLVAYLLSTRGLVLSADLVSTEHLVLIGVLFGSVMHILADALTEGGVPLLWPNPKRFGFPPDRHMRFRTGTWPEHVIVWALMILVGIGVWQAIIPI